MEDQTSSQMLYDMQHELQPEMQELETPSRNPKSFTDQAL